MREIKFKAWDKVESRIIEWEELKTISVFLSYLENYEETDCRILMQFTGLLDKNGVEIYEGDIVKRLSGSFKDSEYNRIGIIEFGRLSENKETGMWEIKTYWFQKVGEKSEEKRDFIYYEPFGLGCEPSRYEIIGNIYSTPELLESNKN